MNRHRMRVLLTGVSALTLALGLALGLGLGLGLALALIARPGVASAHAAYVSSTPAANATVATAPTTIAIHFAQHVAPGSSDIVVLDARGKTVSTGPVQANHSDLKTMTVAMQGDGSEI